MFRRFSSAWMAVAFCLSLFTGCGGAMPSASDHADKKGNGLGFSAFDENLIAALLDSGMERENFSVSPFSARAALTLAALGADGVTRTELFQVLGVSSEEDLVSWYEKALESTSAFQASLETGRSQNVGDAAFRIVNSVWANESLGGSFLPEYQALIGRFDADVFTEPAERMTDEINNWVNRQTEGLIPSIVRDASRSDAVLVNALYLKTGWERPFSAAGVTAFQTIDSETVQKEFIQSQATYRYYADQDSQLVIVPLQGGIEIAFLIGNSEDFGGKLKLAEPARVCVTIPKFKIDTSLDHRELCTFLQAAGCTAMFGPDADFSAMFNKALHVDDIVQKSTVHLDENGIEAAAATAIMMTKGLPHGAMEEPIFFTADQPFSFVIYCGDESEPEVLFYGQIVR